MRQNNTNRLNNRGASLIMVVVCFAFVTMLGTIVLSAALNNIEMKKIDKKSKQNFYSAEAALDEIKVGLSEDVADSLAAAYEIVLERYSLTEEAARDALFESEFTNAMRTNFFSGSSLITGAVFNNYLKETKLNSATGNGAVVSGSPSWSVYSGDSIVFKDVIVIFTMNDYKTTITTDIKVIFPSVAIVSQTGSMEDRPYLNYALIANTGLWINTSSHHVFGDVYAGNSGINVGNQGNELTMNNSIIITSGDITVKDKAQLVVDGTDCEVWAENLITTQSDKTLIPSLNTVINIQGSCYLQDDMVLSAYNSRVTLSGKYYGYSNGFLSDGTSSGDPKDNSAIMVNAAKVSLNLSGLSELRVAGRAFINMDKLTYHLDSAVGAEANANKNILTGESLTIKGAQTPYLVPAEFIAVGHNPVTWSEYLGRYNTTTMVDGMVDTSALLNSNIFTNDLISDTQAKLSYYLNAAIPVKRAFYRFGGDSNVVYYYLNFANEEKATTFLKNYNLCYHDKIYNGFDIESIVVNNTVGSVMASGNLITYDGDDIQVLVGDTRNYINNYASKYDNLIHTLQKNVSSTKSIYENIVNVANVEADTNAITKQVYKVDDSTAYVNIINNDDTSTVDTDPGIANSNAFVFSETGKSGIIIATGDVILTTDFTGMIISGGNVFLEGGANFTAAPALVNQIITDYTDIRKYMNDLSSQVGKDDDWKVIDISSYIVYENWRKN